MMSFRSPRLPGTFGGHNAALYYSLDVHFSKAGSDKRFTHHIYSATFI